MYPQEGDRVIVRTLRRNFGFPADGSMGVVRYVFGSKSAAPNTIRVQLDSGFIDSFKFDEVFKVRDKLRIKVNYNRTKQTLRLPVVSKRLAAIKVKLPKVTIVPYEREEEPEPATAKPKLKVKLRKHG